MLPNIHRSDIEQWKTLHNSAAGDKSAQAIIGALMLVVVAVEESAERIVDQIIALDDSKLEDD